MHICSYSDICRSDHYQDYTHGHLKSVRYKCYHHYFQSHFPHLNQLVMINS